MQRYWWVNHKKTFKAELEGGYLWSPQVEASGARSQFYDNMRLTKPGDRVVSYADGQIKAVGTVTDLAIAAPKPREFGSQGTNWAANGWLVPVAWQRSQTSVRPKDFLDLLLPLLPQKYSPLQRDTGNGNQKAYLSEVSIDAFELICERSSMPDKSTSVAEVFELSSRRFIEEIDSRIEAEILADLGLDKTEKAQLTLSRRGQGAFRRNVILIENTCRCTGIAEVELLIASHIKPWRCCISAQERLDGCNGLLLSPNADHLFDRGLITFGNDGDVIKSSFLSDETLLKLGIQRKNVGKFLSTQIPYLEYHRANIFVN